ncbi:MAG: hypothetical protein WAV48_06740, partial [Candidatus Magasanikiibacteriota bacterium]
YWTGPTPRLNVWWRNPRHARALFNELVAYRGVVANQRRITIVGHSNGCDIALRTAKLLAAAGITVTALILAASVTDPDVDKSGVLSLICSGRLRTAFAYASDHDVPLAIPAMFKWPYSDLGRKGWMANGKPLETDYTIVTRWFPGYGHGDYFSATNRDATFNLIAQDAGLLEPGSTSSPPTE